MTDRVARLRVRSVRMKNGGATVRVLRGDDHDYAGDVRGWVDDCIKEQGDIAGFAFVIWDREGISTVKSVANQRSQIPMILVPEFVKARLLAERIVEWAIEDMKK